jgi:hypothetical protein
MKNTIRYNTKTLVDSNNILWTMDYDGMDNTVTLVSDYATSGTSAVISQYSMDNATGQDIPEQILTSAQDMIAQDEPRRDPIDYIIDEYADASRVFA